MSQNGLYRELFQYLINITWEQQLQMHVFDKTSLGAQHNEVILVCCDTVRQVADQ